MGAWGTGLFEEDVAADVRDEFKDAVEGGLEPAAAADRVIEELEDYWEDDDDGPVMRLALASLLLDAGVANHSVYEEAERVLRDGDGLERWEDSGEAVLAARQAVYQELAARLTARKGTG